MRMAWAALFIQTAFGHFAFAADNTSPDPLREKHAGTAQFSSDEAVETLFPKLLRATQECWVGEVKPGTMGLIVSSASRTVFADLSADKGSAYIIVQAKGFFGALKDNFLQIDLKTSSGSSTVDVYYKNNVKGQRQFIGQVEHWLKGELSYCDPHPFMQKKKQGE